MIVTSRLGLTRNPELRLSFPALHVKQGEKILLQGKSGSGKTTWLSMLAGLLPPGSGEIHVMGQNIFALSETRRDHFRGQHYGFIFQNFHLIPSLTARDNILLACNLARKTLDGDWLHQLSENLGLQNLLDKKPQALSQGEQQRVAIARAMINKPSIIIADEPTSALDEENAEAVMRLIHEQAGKANAVLIVASHDKRISKDFDHVIEVKS